MEREVRMIVRRNTRKEMLDRMSKKVKKGTPVFVAACGTGLVAKCLEQAGADFIVTFSGARLRNNGWGTMTQWYPILDSNQQVIENTERDILTALKGRAGVLTCVQANDPLRDIALVLEYLKKIGVIAISHVGPSIGYYEKGSRMYQALVKAGVTLENEIAMLELAKKMGLITFGMPFDLEDAETIMKGAMPDAFCFHAGTTKGGLVGAEETLTIEETARITEEANQIAVRIKPDVFLLAHGAALETPEEGQYILNHTSCHGIWTGSSTERIPIERAVLETAGKFANLKLKKQ
jgi:predicted TIM-barrel enzyme